MKSPRRIEDVFRELHPRLWRGLLAFTGSVDLASDAEAEAFAQAIARGSEIRDPEAWISKSAYRIAAGLLAKRSKKDPYEAPQERVVDDPPLIELFELLRDLSEQQRIVVILRYVGGYKPTEIADLLDTSPGTVRVQLHRSHESLRLSVRSAHE